MLLNPRPTDRLYLLGALGIVLLAFMGQLARRYILPGAVALALTACHLSPKGRATVAATGAVSALDSACLGYLDRFHEFGPDKYAVAIEECTHASQTGAEIKLCVGAKMAPWERAVTACDVYQHARSGALNGIEGNLAGIVADAIKALTAVGVEVK